MDNQRQCYSLSVHGDGVRLDSTITRDGVLISVAKPSGYGTAINLDREDTIKLIKQLKSAFNLKDSDT